MSWINIQLGFMTLSDLAMTPFDAYPFVAIDVVVLTIFVYWLVKHDVCWIVWCVWKSRVMTFCTKWNEFMIMRLQFDNAETP